MDFFDWYEMMHCSQCKRFIQYRPHGVSKIINGKKKVIILCDNCYMKHNIFKFK